MESAGLTHLKAMYIELYNRAVDHPAVWKETPMIQIIWLNRYPLFTGITSSYRKKPTEKILDFSHAENLSVEPRTSNKTIKLQPIHVVGVTFTVQSTKRTLRKKFKMQEIKNSIQYKHLQYKHLSWNLSRLRFLLDHFLWLRRSTVLVYIIYCNKPCTT